MKVIMNKEYTNPPAKIEDIIAFEEEFKIKLAESYKNFLLENDGGRVDSSESDLSIFYKSFDIDKNEDIECYLTDFNSIKEIKESLIHLLKKPDECFYLDECMKRGTLIIGFENPIEISIGIREDNFGKIYRSNFTSAWNNNELQLIANSFEEFINGFEEEADW